MDSAISCYYNWKGRIIGQSDSQFSIVIKGYGRLNGSSQNYYVEIQLVSYFEFACETRGLNNELNLRPCSNITSVWPQFRIVLSMWCVRSNNFMQKLILAVVFSYLRCLYISNESNITNLTGYMLERLCSSKFSISNYIFPYLSWKEPSEVGKFRYSW